MFLLIIVVSGVSVIGASGHGIGVRNGKNVVITDVNVTDNSKYGLVVEGKSENCELSRIVARKNGFGR